MREFTNEFDYQDLNSVNEADLMKSFARKELVAITNETDGGIIAYAIGMPHAESMVRALNAAAGVYEAEMVSFESRV